MKQYQWGILGLGDIANAFADEALESGPQSAPTGAKLSGNRTEAHGSIAMRFF